MSNRVSPWLRPFQDAAVLLLAVVVLPATIFAQDGEAVATLNGQPIGRKQLTELLIESHGVQALQLLVLRDLAEAEAQKRGQRVAQADIDSEFDEALDELAQGAGLVGPQATRDNKLAALRATLEQRNMSMTEYMLVIERNAYLRAAVRKDLKIDDATLREQFSRLYGERVRVRHIQVSEPRKVNAVLDRINRGEDFAAIARDVSENQESAPRGGLLEPFAFDDANYPAAMREAAFGMKVGGVSPAIQTGNNLQIIRLEERIPPENVRFEDVRDEVLRKTRRIAERERMNGLISEAFKSAQIRVTHPELRRRYEEFRKKASVEPATP